MLFYAYGNFDPKFIIEYCKRHGIKGFDNLKYQNITDIGILKKREKISKDNLCLKLGIKGIQNIYNSYNDCILEWKNIWKIVLWNLKKEKNNIFCLNFNF